jgi:hypothetical protein
LASLVPLVFGLAGDLFVVTRKLTDSVPIALGAASGTVATFLAVWFAVTIYIRTLRHQRTMEEAGAAV